MTSKVIVSWELRLKQGIIGNDNISKTNKDQNSSNVEEIISKLVKLAAGDEGLIQLRGDTDSLYLLHAFVNYYLFYFCTSMVWR